MKSAYFKATLLLASLDLFSMLSASEIIWRNQEKLEGEFIGMEGEWLKWKNELFVSPVEIHQDQIKKIQLSGNYFENKEDFVVRLSDGGVVFGDLLEITDDEILLQSSRHGEIQLTKKAVQSIQRRSHPDITFIGPDNLLKWRLKQDRYNRKTDRYKKYGWSLNQNGEMRAFSWNRPIFRKLIFPEHSMLEIKIGARDMLNFAISTSDDKTKGFTVESWGDQVVFTSGEQFFPLFKISEKLEKGESFLLRMGWKKDTGQISIFDQEGESYFSFLLKAESNKPDVEIPQGEAWNMLKDILKPKRSYFGNISKTEEGLLIENKGAELVVKSIVVKKWDGENPPKLSETNEGEKISWLNGKTHTGEIKVKFELGKRELLVDDVVEGELENLMEVVFNNEEENDKFIDPSRVEITWKDGERFIGKLIEGKKERVSLSSPQFAESVKLNIQDAEKISWLNGTDKKTLKGKDTLFLGRNEKLTGRIVAGEEGKIQWKLNGTRGSSELVEGNRTRIKKGNKETKEKNLPYLVTKNGLQIPYENLVWGEEEMNYQSEWFEKNKIKQDNIQAIHFVGSSNLINGFTSKDWVFEATKLRNREGYQMLSDDKETITFKRTALAFHSTLCANKIDIEFKIDWNNNQWGAIGFGFFTSEESKQNREYDIEISTHGGNIYAQSRNRDNNWSGNSIPSKGSDTVKLQFYNKNNQDYVRVKINEKTLGSQKITKDEGRGHGFSIVARHSNNELKIREFRSGSLDGAFSKVDRKRLRHAVTVPRFKKSNPPTHALVAKSGDILSGKLLGLDSEEIRFETRLEQATYPVNVIDSIIYLEKKEDIKSIPQADSKAFNNNENSVLVKMLNGNEFLFSDYFYDDKSIKGTHEILGKCEIPNHRITEYLFNKKENNSIYPYRDWTLVNAPEPVIPSANGSEQVIELIGQPAPDIELVDLKGVPFSLGDQKGKILVLDFWASWCGPCVKSLPNVINLINDINSENLVFLGVNQGESKVVIEGFQKRSEIQFDTLMDPKEVMKDKYKFSGIPHTVIIDGAGNIHWAKTGAGELEELKQKIYEALKK